MISPDDPILSAYLDGELDPRAARRVERALEADPRITEGLEQLRQVRTLVSGLSRPVPPDLSEGVLRRLEAGTPAVWRPGETRRRWTWAAGGVAAAACLVLAILADRAEKSRGPGRPAAPGPLASRAQDRAGRAAESPVGEAAGPRPPAPLPGEADAERMTRHEGASPAPADTPAADVAATDVERVRRLLDDPALQSCFLVTDRLDRPGEAEVASLVERTSRRDFFKITVAQGIVIDPEHPGKATVFAVVLDPGELPPFRDRLKATFADRVQERAVDPTIALQLADIGQVVSFPAHPVGDVSPPPATELALRTNESRDDAENLPQGPTSATGGGERRRSQPGGTGPAVRPTLAAGAAPGGLPGGNTGQAVGRPPSAPRSALATAERPPARTPVPPAEADVGPPADPLPSTPCVVLVWITDPPSG
jgi:anti-sigma factor RsiW